MLTFRRLREADLPLLHSWLNEPGVVAWWEGDDVSWDGVIAEYGPGSDPNVEHWLALVDNREVGWIQCYPASAFADEEETAAWFRLGVDRTAAGIDYLVADPEQRGSGLGSAMIDAFVTEVVLGRHPDWTQVCASPYVANVASIGALRRAGFEPRGTWTDADGHPSQVMVRSRAPTTDPGTG